MPAAKTDSKSISTHSRAKAAGASPPGSLRHCWHFNSQPREGGWCLRFAHYRPVYHFNSQPREGGWRYTRRLSGAAQRISTHSRAKAAGISSVTFKIGRLISTHSRAKAAGFDTNLDFPSLTISTHSRAKAAGDLIWFALKATYISTHSRAKAAGVDADITDVLYVISTHSRAKAAGTGQRLGGCGLTYFNSQPREGGWLDFQSFACRIPHFNSQPREGGWAVRIDALRALHQFQLTAARRRLEAMTVKVGNSTRFQLTAARRRLDVWRHGCTKRLDDFNSQPREGGWN